MKYLLKNSPFCLRLQRTILKVSIFTAFVFMLLFLSFGSFENHSQPHDSLYLYHD